MTITTHYDGGGSTCTCGETKAHIVAKKRTYDNIGLMAWSDGKITTWDGRELNRKPLTAVQRNYFMSRAWLYDFAEIRKLIADSRKSA